MNIQATKLELIRMITDIQSEQLLESLKEFLKRAEHEGRDAGAHRLSKEETDLLSAINKGLPETIHNRFRELQTKQREGKLLAEEHAELMTLVDTVEALEAERLENMIALAGL